MKPDYRVRDFVGIETYHPSGYKTDWEELRDLVEYAIRGSVYDFRSS